MLSWPQRSCAWRTISATGASAAFSPRGLPVGTKALISAVSVCRSAGVLKAALLPQGMERNISVTSPL